MSEAKHQSFHVGIEVLEMNAMELLPLRMAQEQQPSLDTGNGHSQPKALSQERIEEMRAELAGRIFFTAIVTDVGLKQQFHIKSDVTTPAYRHKVLERLYKEVFSKIRDHIKIPQYADSRIIIIG